MRPTASQRARPAAPAPAPRSKSGSDAPATAMTANLAAASPMYIVLAQTLARAIRSGSYRAGQSLPSERLLSESLQVSRETARRALTQLVEQQLVERRPGSGSYVRP